MTYKIITEEVEAKIDENKRIEETVQVEQKSVFTISDLKRQIEEIDNETARLAERKSELLAKIDAVVEDLDLTLTK